jgi:TonB-dependent receptor
MTFTKARLRETLLCATACLACTMPVSTVLAQTAATQTVPVAAQTGVAQTEAAQTEAAQAGVPQRESETIIVRGSRPIQESDRAALLVQRNAPSVVSVLSADEAGRLADQNIAFAVSRLPGVAVERDQGQARYVNLRGQPRRWTNISIDGLNIVSPEGRQSRFDNTPSAIASQVLVTKAVTPDMPGDTVSGNVDIRTRSAFDYKGRAIRGGIQLGRVELGGGQEIDANLVVSNRFANDTIGLLAQASYYEREMVTDNWETDPYLTPGGTVQGATGPSGIDRRPGSETRRWAREHENKLYRLTRGNISGSLRADWRPSEDVSLFAQTVYTQFTDNELRNNYIFRFDNGATNTPTTACPTTGPIAVTSGNGANDICNGNTPFAGTVYGARLSTNFRTASIKEYVSTNTLGGAFKLAEWDVDWRANYTFAEDGQSDAAQPFFQSASSPASRPTVVYDFTNPDLHRVELYRTVVAPGTNVRSRGERVMSVESFATPFVEIESVDGGSETTAWTSKIDFSRELSLFGRASDVKFGGLYTDREKINAPKIYTAEAADLTAAGLPQFSYADVAIDGPFLGEMPLGYSFRYYSQDKLVNYMRDLISRGVAKRNDGDEDAAYYKVTERTFAAYAMANSKFDWGGVVYGVRLETTKNTGEAISPVNGATVRTQSDDELEVFPSVHVNYDLNDEMKVRLGFTTGASRPDYDQLAPNFQVDNGPRTITGGNPDAQPERAIGVDAYWEWYRTDRGYVSAGIFYKRLSDVLFTESRPFASDILGAERADFTYITVRNGGEGYIGGLELTWNQFIEDWVEKANGPDWVKGFGWRATATLTESEMDVPAVLSSASPARTLPLSGASDLVYNLSLVYERYGFSARLAYQYRTDWLQAVGGYTTVNNVVVPSGNGDVYWATDDELDLSLRYEVREGIELTFDAVNLIDKPAVRYADSEDRPIEREKFGPRYMAGVRFKF